MIKQFILLFLLSSVYTKRQWKRKYDYVIVEGGAAGCVLATRLSESPWVSVLVLEAGRSSYHNSLVSVPKTYLNILLNREFSYQYRTEPEPALDNRTLSVSAGKILGGSSSHNSMVYHRGSRHDFDHWEELGNKGWGYDDVLPYFKKSEMVLSPELVADGYHGTEGPIKTNWAYELPIQNVTLNAAEELGYHVTDDNNGRYLENVGACQVTIDEDGKRSTPAESYLRPALGRPNLDLVTGAFVRKIKIRRLKAVGVIFEIKNGGKMYFVRATKEVIVSAGAANSPKILMLSGIGPREHLQSVGIKVESDLPVGTSIRDHPGVRGFLYSTNLTYSKLLSSKELFTYIFQGKGIWTSNDLQALGFFPSKTQPTDSKVPFIEIVFGFQVLKQEILGFLLSGSTDMNKFFNAIKKAELEHVILEMAFVQLHPRTKGTYKLRSKDPDDPPIVRINHLADENDIKDFIEAVRISQQFTSTKAMKEINANFVSPPDPRCISHGFNTDQYWRCVLRKTVGGSSHWTSSCPMGPNGVVTDQLRVKGIWNLRVVDASVMPDSLTGHPMAATIMIAEKAADLIKHSNK